MYNLLFGMNFTITMNLSTCLRIVNHIVTLKILTGCFLGGATIISIILFNWGTLFFN